MNGRARGTERFNCPIRLARPLGRVLLFVSLLVLSPALALAQLARPSDLGQSGGDVEPTPRPFPRVYESGLRSAAERIYGLMNDLNERHVQRAGNILERAGLLLDRIDEATERRTRQGYDTAAAREAVATARERLDEARIAVRDQADRTYVLDDATDYTVRDRLHAARDELKEDLAVVRSAVGGAISAVRDAARALRMTRSSTP